MKHFISLLSLSACASVAQASDLSFNGHRGYFTAPSAQVLESGDFVFQYNTHQPKDFPQIDDADNYNVGIGMFPNVEVVGHIAAARSEPGQFLYNDLSANVKVRLLEREHFAFAVGLQDISGDAQKFETQYAVVDGYWKNVTASLGYSRNPVDIDGVFAGLKVDLGEYVQLLAEHDGNDQSAGVRAGFSFYKDWRFSTLVRAWTNADVNEDVEFSAALSIPLGSKTPLKMPQSKAGSTAIQALKDAGLSRVKVKKTAENELVLGYENRRYLHNNLDGLEVAISQVLAHAAPEFEQIRLVEFREGLPIKSTKVNRDGTRLSRWANADDKHSWLDMSNDAYMLELNIRPHARTAVAHDIGDGAVLSHSLALRPALRLHAPAGFTAHVSADLQVSESDDFAEEPTLQRIRHRNGLHEAMLQYHYTLGTGAFGLASLGYQHFEDRDFTMLDNELVVHNWAGDLQARLHTTFAEDQDGESYQQIIAGAQAYFFEERTSLDFSVGTFMFEDSIGLQVVLNRHFGDSTVFLKWKGANSTSQTATIGLSIPLTPRRGMKPGRVYVTGANRFSYALTTVINDESGMNFIRPRFLVEDGPLFNIRNQFLDSSRLVPGYIR